MSKKQIHNRLEDLFLSLSENAPSNPGQEAAVGSGWTGEESHAAEDRPALEKPVTLPEPHTIVSGANGKAISTSTTKSEEPTPLPSPEAANSNHHERRGFAMSQQRIQPAGGIWTETGKRAAQRNALSVVNSEGDQPATIAIPLETQGAGRLLLEIIDDSNARSWSEDDRFLVMEVAAQLALALDNAELYLSVQQELAERIRAEKAILRRNRDLAVLNQVGQQLSRLATRTEIFELLAAMIGDVLENNNLYICVYSPGDETLSFPVCLVDGRAEIIPARPFDEGIPEYAIHSHTALIIAKNAADELRQRGIHLPERIPASLLAIPMITGEKPLGAIVVQDFTHENAFDTVHVELLSTAASQAATALENADLFEQIQAALSETELLYQVSNGISQASSPPNMLSLVTESILPAGADKVSLLLIESDPGGQITGLELVGSQDIKGEYLPLGMHLPVDHLPIIKSLADEPLLIDNTAASSIDAASSKTFAQLGMAACCMVPLRTGGHMIGTLVVSAQSPDEFQPEEINLLRIAGNGIAVALEKQRLLVQAQRRALELQTASEIARDTASTLSLDLLLSRIVKMLSERFNFSHTAIFLLDEARTMAVVRESTGILQSDQRVAVGSRSVVGTVTATGEPLMLNDAANNPAYTPDPRLPETRSEMGIPLRLGDTVIGALDLHSKDANAFDQDDIAVLQILSDQIAIGIENARAYELSQKAIADMQEVDRVKSQFLANMSHELRTPLNSIIGFSRVILKGIDGPINETQQQDLSAIYNSGQHLLSLITDILDLSKIEAGKMELAFTEINVADLINSAMSTASGLVKDKAIHLHSIVPDNLPPVRADNTRVRQVLINFLSNAAKFTDEGTITVEASLVNGLDHRPEVMVAVTDTGPGIAPQDQGKLFLPFSQVDDSPTRKTGGTGLGLSICRSLIEMHGGRIGLLRSEVGRGSTFFFTLPASSLDLVIKSQADEAASNIVLAIDDDPKVISLYERYLKSYGYQIIPLTDPNSAVLRAKEIQPFAITLDIMMPGKDGWQVLRELKNDPQTRDIPIIVCSIMESQEKGFSMGATDYLVKPFMQEEMIGALDRLDQDGNMHEVLIVDDDADDLRLLQKMLEESRNYHVIPAQGGQEGWEIIQTKKPDAIILDLFMPDMNGFHILQNLRADPTLREIPVVVLTGADLTPEQYQQLADFGQGALGKGYLRENELLVLLKEALRKFRPVARQSK